MQKHLCQEVKKSRTLALLVKSNNKPMDLEPHGTLQTGYRKLFIWPFLSDLRYRLQSYAVMSVSILLASTDSKHAQTVKQPLWHQYKKFACWQSDLHQWVSHIDIWELHEGLWVTYSAAGTVGNVAWHPQHPYSGRVLYWHSYICSFTKHSTLNFSDIVSPILGWYYNIGFSILAILH